MMIISSPIPPPNIMANGGAPIAMCDRVTDNIILNT